MMEKTGLIQLLHHTSQVVMVLSIQIQLKLK